MRRLLATIALLAGLTLGAIAVPAATGSTHLQLADGCVATSGGVCPL